ncbi:MAG: tyrosine-type recombinase/integrase [Pseudomonadota bacterium]|nr:tyrosine-type recombinase/integrase [Pseudomonadota bacterium]
MIEQLPFQSCYSAFRSALERANIKLPKGQLTHICRHTFASHFVMNGGHILTLQKVLGHSDLKLTMRYAHLAPDFLSEVLHKSPAI